MQATRWTTCSNDCADASLFWALTGFVVRKRPLSAHCNFASPRTLALHLEGLDWWTPRDSIATEGDGCFSCSWLHGIAYWSRRPCNRIPTLPKILILGPMLKAHRGRFVKMAGRLPYRESIFTDSLKGSTRFGSELGALDRRCQASLGVDSCSEIP